MKNTENGLVCKYRYFICTMCIHPYIHACVYVYIHTYIHTYPNTYIHTVQYSTVQHRASMHTSHPVACLRAHLYTDRTCLRVSGHCCPPIHPPPKVQLSSNSCGCHFNPPQPQSQIQIKKWQNKVSFDRLDCCFLRPFDYYTLHRSTLKKKELTFLELKPWHRVGHGTGAGRVRVLL